MSDIVIIAASDNKNLELAKEFESGFTRHHTQSRIIDVVALDFPLYSSQTEKAGTPKNLQENYSLLMHAKAMVFVAPEYNGGIPPVLTNFIAWMSRSGDKDWRKAFNEKSAVIATYSGGGGLYLLNALRAQLSFIGMNILGRQILTNGQKALDPGSLEAVVKQLIYAIR